jgi:Holliday junction resolvase RusA-like endonuclease
MKIEFILPFPPSTNAKYGMRGKKRVKGKDVLDWIKSAHSALDKQNITQIMDKRCVLVYELFVPDGRPRDDSNYVKYTTDFLVERGLLNDDSRRFVKGTYSFWNDDPGKYIKVSIVPAASFNASY